MNRVHVGEACDVLAGFAANTFHCCVTSPPYWSLRDYGHERQIGQERTPAEYVTAIVRVFREVRRVLRDDGTCWVNIGDTYAAERGRTSPPADSATGDSRGMSSGANWHRKASAFGLKHKDLVGIPHRVALAMQADGWYWRSDIIWHKPSAMPERVTDRPTRNHEHVLLFSKSERYEYHAPRQSNVWTVSTDPNVGGHFAVMPVSLAERCCRAGTAPGGRVLDPFGGMGTTAIAASSVGASADVIELNPDYARFAVERIERETRQQSLFGMC